jgi:hypothetical protein
MLPHKHTHITEELTEAVDTAYAKITPATMIHDLGMMIHPENTTNKCMYRYVNIL